MQGAVRPMGLAMPAKPDAKRRTSLRGKTPHHCIGIGYKMLAPSVLTGVKQQPMTQAPRESNAPTGNRAERLAPAAFARPGPGPRPARAKKPSARNFLKLYDKEREFSRRMRLWPAPCCSQGATKRMRFFATAGPPGPVDLPGLPASPLPRPPNVPRPPRSGSGQSNRSNQSSSPPPPKNSFPFSFRFSPSPLAPGRPSPILEACAAGARAGPGA